MKFSLARNKQIDPYSANFLYPNSPLANEQSSCRKNSKEAKLHNKSAHINNNTITNYGAKQLNSQSFRQFNQFNLNHRTSVTNTFGNNKQMKIPKTENKNQQAAADANNLFFCRQNTKRRNKKQFSLKSNQGNYNSTIVPNNSRLQRFGYSPPQMSTDIPENIKFKNFISHAYNFKSLENINQNVNKQSFIPSQKTVALNNTLNGLQNNFVYRSHVTTQKGCAFQMTERPLIMKDNMKDLRMIVSPSTPRIRFDYGQIQQGYDSPKAQKNQQQNKTKCPKMGVESQMNETISKSSFEEHLIWNNKDQSNIKNHQNLKIKKTLQQSQEKYNNLSLQFIQLQNRLKHSEEVNHQLNNRILQLEDCSNNKLMPQQLKQIDTKTIQNNLIKLLSNEQSSQLFGNKTAQVLKQTEAKLYQYETLIKDNNERIINLQIQIQNLNLQLHNNKQINKKSLNIAHTQIIELRDIFQNQAIKKDKEIENLSQQINTLNISLNKKDQIIQKLQQEMIKIQKYKNKYKNSHLTQVKQDKQHKPELGDLHEHIFTLQWEEMILENKNQNLAQKLMQKQQQLKKITLQNQKLKRQIRKLENCQHQKNKLQQILNKKDNELLAMTDLILERNQHFGQYSTLSVQNQKLKELLMKKNQELSQLTYRQHNDDLKRRQFISLENSYNQKQLQILRLHSILSNKDIRIEQLHQSFAQMKRSFEQIESELKRHKKIVQQNQSLIKSKIFKQQQYEGQIIKILKINHYYQEEANNLNSKLQKTSFQLSKKIENENKIGKDLEKAQINIENINKELENKIKQKLILKQQKQQCCKQIQQIEKKHSELLKDYQQISHKFIQAKNSLKNKDNKILYLQQQISSLNQQLKKHNNCSKQIGSLTDKISAYQLTILKLNMNRPVSNSFGTLESNQSIKDKIIQQLKSQNNSLKKDIHFYEKEEVQLEQEKSIRHQRSLVENIGDKQQKSRQKLQNKKHNFSSKSMQDLFQYFHRQNFSKRHQMNHNNKKIITPQYIEMIYSQQVLFYKQKTIQLEQQINNHIKMNKDLKNILDKMINNKDNASKQFHKHQYKRYEDQITFLKQENIHLLQDRNRIMQKVQEYQHKDVTKETVIRLPKHNNFKQSDPEIRSDISDHTIVDFKKGITDYEKRNKLFK